MKNQKVLFVIPARSGSKGIIDKNIQKCGTDTLLRLSVKICKNIEIDSHILFLQIVKNTYNMLLI